MRMKFVALLLMLTLCSAFAADSKSLFFQPFTNRASITDAEALRINEVFANRLKTEKGWALIDTAAIKAQNIPSPCDQDCLIHAAEQLKADMILTGSIEPTNEAGVIEIKVTLLDPANWREVQAESKTIGPDIEKDLGQVSAMAKLFDPKSATAAQTPEDRPDTTSTTANWVLSGAALMVLAVVLYSLL